MTGQRVLVTGASRGLGRCFVEHLVARGDRVYAGCRDPQDGQTLEQLSSDHPGAVVALELDVADPATIDAALACIDADGGGVLDVLINNAGVSPRGERFGNVTAQAMQDVFSVNTVAPMLVCQKAYPLLCQSQAPRIINISSSMGAITQKDYGRHYSYASSKAALNMLTRASAHDLRDDGITVVALHPGWVCTDLGGAHAALGPAESVAGMIDVIDRLTLDDTSLFFTWEGEQHPW